METNAAGRRTCALNSDGVEELVPVEPVPLSLLQRILLTTDGTVSRILEQYVGEPVVVVKLRQALVPATTAIAELGVEAGETVLTRDVLLRGRDTRRNLVHAESVLCPGHLGAPLVNRLLASSVPIGELFRQYRLETFREILASGEEGAGWLSKYFGTEPSACLAFRTYRIVSGGRPVALITERFPTVGPLSDTA